MEKQIKEMARDIFESSPIPEMWYSHAKRIAEKLYEQGYRKQEQGEWKVVSEKYPRYACTACNHLYNNKEFKYCPNCGAKMKGN